MGKQVIRQPNGRLAYFSDGTDTITVLDADRDEMIEHLVEQKRRELDDRLRRYRAQAEAEVDEVIEGGRPYYQFGRTWESALARHNEANPDNNVIGIEGGGYIYEKGADEGDGGGG